jgi:hypothetical protein
VVKDLVQQLERKEWSSVWTLGVNVDLVWLLRGLLSVTRQGGVNVNKKVTPVIKLYKYRDKRSRTPWNLQIV